MNFRQIKDGFNIIPKKNLRKKSHCNVFALMITTFVPDLLILQYEN